MTDPTAPHVSLVLGAGGPVGQAFLAGVLDALDECCGWDARDADLIIGTSAGSQIGALLRAGWDARRLLQRATALPPIQPQRRRRRWPSSPAYLRAVATHPWRARPGPLLTALLPEGTNQGPHLGDSFKRLFPWRWPRRPLWIPALHVDRGARVVFGRGDAPRVDVATAVRCSSAVPSLREPITVGADRYVDGGVTSPTHADLAATNAAPERHHVVIVVSPLSRFAPLRLLLRWELVPLLRRGVDVILFEPDRTVTAAMGWNPLDASRTRAVAEAAFAATRARLQRGDVATIVRRLVGS